MKIILITQRIDKNDNEIKSSLSIDWQILFNNYSNVLLFPIFYNVNLDNYIDNFEVSGIILSGGNDIYNCNQNEYRKIESEIRNNFENEIIKIAIKKNIPLLGICRGCQLLGLYDNLELKKDLNKNHVKIKHQINIVNKDTLYLHNWIRQSNLEVNSYHNYVLCDNKKNHIFEIICKSKDDYIEALESKNKNEKILGIMWHPERNTNISDINLIADFFKLKKKKPQIIILCAGMGNRMRPYTNNKHKCMVKYKEVPIINYIHECLRINNLDDKIIISGYKRNTINLENSIEIVNEDYKNTNMVSSLFCAESFMTGNSDLIISYSDIIYSPKVLEKLLNSNEKISVVIDKEWFNQWKERMDNPLEDAETLKLDNNNYIQEIGKKPKSYDEIEGQYIGLIKIRKDIVNEVLKFFKNLKSEKNMYMTDFLTLISKNISPLKAILINGGWCEFDCVTDLKYNLDVSWYKNTKKLEFSTKANNLKNLENKLEDIYISKLYIFTYREWCEDKDNILNIISNKFKNNLNNKIIIRSSSINEDNINFSNAGKYKSINNIDPNNKNDIKISILEIFESYGNINMNDQILIQKSLNQIICSGVMFTFDCLTNSNYYVLSYDESGNNDNITNGVYSNKEKKIYKVKKYEHSRDKYFKRLINLSNKLEKIYNNDKLDIEFCFTKENNIVKLYLLQVRQLIIKNTNNTNNILEDKLLNGDKLLNIHGGIKNSYNSYFKNDKDIILSVMSDWNPAEIIGINSKNLAISLYKKLITNYTAMFSRRECGYKDMTLNPLMITFLNKSYINTKISFNSLIPNSLDKNISDKLCSYYLTKLKNNLDLHDKIEFSICFTCNTISLLEDLNILKNYNFTKSEIKQIYKSVVSLTNNIINPSSNYIKKEYDRLNKLEIESERILKSNKNKIRKIYELLQILKTYGTLPFSNLARYAFIGKSILLSFVKKNILSQRDYEDFLKSLKTVSKNMLFDIYDYSINKISKKEFLEKYGHLRPGTYDITSKRYKDDFDLYFPKEYLNEIKKNNCEEFKKIKKFELSNDKKLKIDNELNKSLFLKSINNNIIFTFIKKSIEAREESKFIFTKTLSNILELIKEFLKELDINTSDGANLDIDILINLNRNLNITNTKQILEKNINNNIKNYNQGVRINLPEIIINEQDFLEYTVLKSTPTFITRDVVRAKIIFISNINDVNNEKNKIENKIVCVYNADPGWEWLFSRNIKGLITCYGGMNSHIAIRCQELLIPAAIGCGPENFKKYIKKNIIELNCSLKTIKYI